MNEMEKADVGGLLLALFLVCVAVLGILAGQGDNLDKCTGTVVSRGTKLNGVDQVLTEQGVMDCPLVEACKLYVRSGSKIHILLVGAGQYNRFMEGSKVSYVVNGFNTAYIPTN